MKETDTFKIYNKPYHLVKHKEDWIALVPYYKPECSDKPVKLAGADECNSLKKETTLMLSKNTKESEITVDYSGITLKYQAPENFNGNF